METKEDEKYEKHFYLCNEKGKPIHTSRQNLFSAIKEFLLYMSNEDIEKTEEHIEWIKKHRVKVVSEVS
jgi:hypothetical protein